MLYIPGNDYAAVAFSIHFGEKITQDANRISDTHEEATTFHAREFTFNNDCERREIFSNAILRPVTSRCIVMSNSETTILEISKWSKPRVDVKFPIIAITHDLMINYYSTFTRDTYVNFEFTFE